MIQKKDPLKSLLDVRIKMKKTVFDAPKLYVLLGERVIVCSVNFHLNFTSLMIKFSADILKDEITPSLKANGRLKFVQYVEIIRVIEKGNIL